MLLIVILTMHIEKNIPMDFFNILGKKNPKSLELARSPTGNSDHFRFPGEKKGQSNSGKGKK